jgi:pyrophosphatase PpaX
VITTALFDLDGTLTDTMGLTLRGIRYALEPLLGRPLSDTEIFEQFGPPEPDIIRALVGPQKLSTGLQRLQDYYDREIPRIRTYDGIRTLLSTLRERGVMIGLATGRGRDNTLRILRQVRLDVFMEVVVTGSDHARHKPDPEGVLRAIRLLHVRPEETLFVGDTRADIQAGRAAGVVTAAALWGCTEGDEWVEEERPDLRFYTVNGMRDWVEDHYPPPP